MCTLIIENEDGSTRQALRGNTSQEAHGKGRSGGRERDCSGTSDSCKHPRVVCGKVMDGKQGEERMANTERDE